jgi:hypothetical protein
MCGRLGVWLEQRQTIQRLLAVQWGHLRQEVGLVIEYVIGEVELVKVLKADLLRG